MSCSRWELSCSSERENNDYGWWTTDLSSALKPVASRWKIRASIVFMIILRAEIRGEFCNNDCKQYSRWSGIQSGFNSECEIKQRVACGKQLFRDCHQRLLVCLNTTPALQHCQMTRWETRAIVWMIPRLFLDQLGSCTVLIGRDQKACESLEQWASIVLATTGFFECNLDKNQAPQDVSHHHHHCHKTTHTLHPECYGPPALNFLFSDIFVSSWMILNALLFNDKSLQLCAILMTFQLLWNSLLLLNFYLAFSEASKVSFLKF